jgi:hypothetical protein
MLNIFFASRGFRAGPGLDPESEDWKSLMRNKIYSRSTKKIISDPKHYLSELSFTFECGTPGQSALQ